MVTIPRLQALTKANLAVSSELDLDAVLQIIADTAREFGDAKYAALGLINEQGKISSFITSGISKEDREKIGEPPRGHGLLGVLIKNGTSIRVSDITKDARHSGFPPNHPVMTSLLGVPVTLQGKVIGDLYLTDKTEGPEFTAEDEWWVTLFARQAAVAVENANLFKKAQISQKKAETLAQLAGSLSQSIDPKVLFGQITRSVCLLLELPAAALYLLNANRTQFDLQYQTGMQVNEIGKYSIPANNKILEQVLLTGNLVTVTENSDIFETAPLPLSNGLAPSSLLVIPIKQREQVTGIIETYSVKPRRYTPEDISLLEAFAGHAALVLEKAQLYQQKEEFLSMTAHDLRAPLTAIKMSAGLLEACIPPDVPPVFSQLVSNLRRNSERLQNMLDDLLDLNRLEQGRIQLKLDKIELSEAISTCIHSLSPLFDEKTQAVIFDRPKNEYWISADRKRLEQALVNLLTNANKYTPPSGFVKIFINEEDNSIIISIQDSGPGIPPEEQTRIFDRFYRRPMHENALNSAGSGLGLPIARYLIELHGGQLWVESKFGFGSSFFIKLPLTG